MKPPTPTKNEDTNSPNMFATQEQLADAWAAGAAFVNEVASMTGAVAEAIKDCRAQGFSDAADFMEANTMNDTIRIAKKNVSEYPEVNPYLR